MATGISHHINPWGDIEPCPIIQFAKESIHDERDLFDVFNDSAFLRDFRELAAQTTRGCIVLERPDLVKALVEKHAARDTTHREAGAGLAELGAMTPPAQPAQPRPRDPRRALGLPLRQEALVLRLRRLQLARRPWERFRMHLPVISLPRAVPTQSARPPQANIPQTQAERDQITAIVRGYVERYRPVPPLPSTSCASTPIASSPPPASTRRTATTSASSSTTRRGATRWRRSPTSAGCCCCRSACASRPSARRRSTSSACCASSAGCARSRTCRTRPSASATRCSSPKARRS